MTTLNSFLKYILLVVLYISNNCVYADMQGIIKPYLWGKNPILDTQFKATYDDKVKAGMTFISLQIRPDTSTWDLLPEYYISAKDDRLGKVTIGGHNADILMVDAGTFAVGSSDILRDGNHLYSQSLINKLQPQGYRYKVSYLLKRENFYLSSAYSPFDDTTQARFLYADSLSSSTDFKGSVSIINEKIVSGFNLRYLGIIVGGSYGGDFYTAGFGYSIGHFKSSLTYLSEGKNTIFGMQYNLNKNISPFFQIGYSTQDRQNVSLGLKFTV